MGVEWDVTRRCFKHRERAGGGRRGEEADRHAEDIGRVDAQLVRSCSLGTGDEHAGGGVVANVPAALDLLQAVRQAAVDLRLGLDDRHQWRRRRVGGARRRRRGRRAGRGEVGRWRRPLGWPGRGRGGRRAWLWRRVPGRRRRAGGFRSPWRGRGRSWCGRQHAEAVVGRIAGERRCVVGVEGDRAAVPRLRAARGHAAVVHLQEAAAFECGTTLRGRERARVSAARGTQE